MKQVASGALQLVFGSSMANHYKADLVLPYPGEISSFEGLTKGKINNGDVTNASNVEH